jgi:hypothetical protein
MLQYPILLVISLLVFRSVSWTCAILSNFSAACPLFVLTLLPSSDTCLLGKSLSLRPQQSVSYWGVSLGRSGRAFINGSLGWSTYCSDVLVLQRFLGLLLKENGCHWLWWKKSTPPVFMFWFFNSSWASFWRKIAAIVCGGKSLRSPSSCFGSSMVLGPPFEEKWLPLSLVAKVYAPRLHLVMRSGR